METTFRRHGKMCPEHPPKAPSLSLTSWSPPSRGLHASTLPLCVISIIKTAREAKLTFTPLRLSKQLKVQLPAWFHLGAPPRAYNKLKDECLRNRHRVGKVKNLCIRKLGRCWHDQIYIINRCQDTIDG